MTLVQAPEHSDAEPWNVEGAGVVSSWADLGAALTADSPDGAQVVLAATAAGLDTLAVAMNPLASLSAAGVGWLIEHVSFLHEPLDALAGDPTQITAQARTWHAAAGAMRATAEAYRADAAAVTGWAGPAAEAYRGSAADLVRDLGRAAGAADVVATEILTSGAAVGTVRALVRDAVADFVGTLIAEALEALALSFASFGGSALGFAAAAALQAVALAERIGSRIEQLLELLGTSAERLSEALSTMERLRGPALEAGTQLAAVGQEQRAW